MAKSKSGPVYQLKITLADIKPPVWRRVEVTDCTLSGLHQVIQIVLGWGGFHLWAFDIGGEQYGEDPTGEMEMTSAGITKLSKVVRAGVKKFRYTQEVPLHLRFWRQLETCHPGREGAAT